MEANMSDRNILFGKRRALVQGIVASARQDAYAAFQHSDKQKYRSEKAPITPAVIDGHLSGQRPIAIYTVVGDKTCAAVLDLDDHDKSLAWSEIVAAAATIIAMLQAMGLKPFWCRSGGGSGMHIWLIWEKPQLAKLVRQFLNHVIEANGFKNGTDGVKKREIEVFPKNDFVKDGSYGNAVAPPFSRKSVPLNSEFMPVDWDEYMPPSIDELYSPDVAEIFHPTAAPQAQSPLHTAPEVSSRLIGEVLPGDEEEARSALKVVDADDYDAWIRVGLALKCSLGAGAFDIWDEWSRKSAKYPGYAECRKLWDSFAPDGTLTIGTVFHLARERGWQGPQNLTVRKMNARFGILTYGSNTRIIVKQPSDGEVLTLLGKHAFIDRMAPEKFGRTDDHGAVSNVPVSGYWLTHRYAAHYYQVTFDPNKPPGHNGTVWNMWQGFGVKPRQGEWGLLQNHIHTNVCRGDDDLNDWLLNWMALGVQQPGTVIGTAPVLKGLPGTGKGILANAYGHLWGRHYVSITKDDHVSGRFNQHLEGRRFVYVDEAMFGGDRRNAGVIKTMLTEPRIMIERKGVDPIWLDNHMIFMIASNERSVVPADIGDRRWQVLQVGDAHREDRKYFGAIKAELAAGGHEAMLFDLLSRDISVGPDPQVIIRTPELFDQIIQAQGPIERYLYQVLDAGILPQPEAPGNGAGISTIEAMYEDMKRTQPNAHYVQLTLFGRSIGEVFPGIRKVQSGCFIVGRDARGSILTRRSTRYHLPPLQICRQLFEFRIGQKIPWSNALVDWQGDDSADGQTSAPDGNGREPPF
jgi:hypothetical protein